MTNPTVIRRILHWSFLALALAAFALLCRFKILDRDFWWHITAGKMMWQQGGLIETEPFAYTRAGLPYVATHEWLAQLLLYAAYAAGGAMGMIALRTAMMAATFSALLAIDPRRIWPNAALAVAGAGAALGTFLERPQLFTFLITALQLLLATRYLSTDDETRHGKRGWLPLAGMLGLQVLWVNLHGGAALVGLVIIGALAFQRLADRKDRLRDAGVRREAGIVFAAGVGMAAALFVSPNGLHTIDYLRDLLTDKTIAFISEWKPREHGYALSIGPFWALWILTLVAVRRDAVFCAIVAGVTGYLSIKAVRHEPLFVFASLAVTFHQLRHARAWEQALSRLAAAPLPAVAASLLVLVPVATFAHAGYRNVVERDYLWGYGVFAPGAGAADFAEKENLAGNMFNTYGIGGYLIWRFSDTGISGYGDTAARASSGSLRSSRPVFIDGRNVDYGFDFMNAAFVAGHSPEEWKVIEDRYDLSYALIDYDAIKQEGWLSYSRVLDKDARWPMLYIDDWTAVYAKDTPGNRAAIAGNRYRLLTAEGLEFGTALSSIPKERHADLEAELRRAIESSPESVKARVLLAKLLLGAGRVSEAIEIADTVEALRPQRPEGCALRAAGLVAQSKYAEAGAQFECAVRLAGDDYPDLNFAAIADVFGKAGDLRKQNRYRARAGLPPLAAPAEPTRPSASSSAAVSGAATGTGSADIGSLLSGIGDDIISHNDDGIALAEAGKLGEAREAFLGALMLDPGNPLTLTNLCALSMQQSNLDEAIEYCERGRGRGGEESADLHYNLSLAYARKNRFDKATWHLGRAEALGRDVTEMRAYIGRLEAAGN